MSPNTRGTWKCGNKSVCTYRGIGILLDRSTLKIKMVKGLVIRLEQ
jgi:hypothetical protein